MAKRKRIRRYAGRLRRYRARSKDHRFPLSFLPAIVVPAGAILGGGDGQTGMIAAFNSGNMSTIATEAKNILPLEIVGYRWDGTWDFGIILRNLGLIVGGVAAHSLANRFGLNRQMKKVPFVGKYISI